MHTIEPDARSNSLPQVAWGALVLIWGTTWLGVRIGLDDLPPLTFAGIRFLVASVVLFAVLWVRGTRLPR
ncbi:MAG: EamA family transporter, partial [Gemmatimonadales bacterium]